MAYKTLLDLAPTYMSYLFQNVSQVSSRATWSSQSNLLYAPRRCLCIGRWSLQYSGEVLYNNLDNNIKESQSLATFKHKSLNHFM